MSNNNLSKGKTDRFNYLSEENNTLNSNSNNRDRNSYSNSYNNLIDQDINKDMFLADGIYKSSDKVLPRNHKLSTENNMTIADSGNINRQDANREGSKKNDPKKNDLKSIRSRTGFNWQKMGRQLAVTATIIGIFIVLLFSFVAAWALNRYSEAPNITENNLYNIKESSVVYARDQKTKIYEFFDDSKKEYVKIDRIPEVMQLAAMAMEDEKYYYNDLIPWSNIIGAAVACAQGGFSDCRGGSGFVQQLVKLVQKDDQSNLDRKIRELFTALKLGNEGVGQDGKKLNKSDILELYLNYTFYARNSTGVQVASKSYFGHDIDARENPNDPNSPYLLTPPKACYLAALVQQPSRFAASIENPASPVRIEFEKRKDACLYKLAGDGKGFSLRGEGQPVFIANEQEYEKWRAIPVEFSRNRFDDPFPHFRAYIQEEIVKFLRSINLTEQELSRRGLKIITTLDPDIQRKAEEIFSKDQARIQSLGGNNAAGLIMDGPTGEIISMVGSVDYNNDKISGKVNIMTTPQQPGSSIKPIVYANLFDKGFNPGTVLIDTPTTFAGNWKPQNFNDGTGSKYYGNVTVREAHGNSLNITAIKAGYLGGGAGNQSLSKSITSVLDFAETIGEKFPCFPNLEAGCENDNTLEIGPQAIYRKRCAYAPLFIGGCEVNPIAHATAINTLAQEGNLRTATPFISIVDKFGQELFTPENRNKLYPKADKVIRPEIARQVMTVMTDLNRPAFGNLTKLMTIPGWNLCGKTGTTDFNVDTWMVGCSPLYTTITWAGNSDNSPMKDGATASNVSLPIWNSLQKLIHDGKKPVNFSTEGLIKVKLNKQTGLLDDKSNYEEWLTPEQKKLLEQAREKFGKPDFDPRKMTMYENRSPIVTREVQINSLDGKLAVEGKTLSENIVKKTCFDYVGEIPTDPAWYNQITAWAKNKPDQCGTLTPSDQDQVAEKSKLPPITVNPNLQNGQLLPSSFNITFNTNSSSKKIVAANVKVNGSVAKIYSNSGGDSQLSFDVSLEDIKAFAPNQDTVSISIEATDNQGGSYNKGLSNMKVYSSTLPVPNPTSTPTSTSFSALSSSKPNNP
jgi:membrane peptidoglycan carboxypeptidase